METADQPRGIVFDIREFTVHDGPGIRTTVFLKGCPLRCAWCHNPEGLLPGPQLLLGPRGGRVSGRTYGAAELAAILLRQAPLFGRDGGVTLSGGEPLAQAAFAADLAGRLEGIHVTLDTSGHASEDDFRLVAGRCDLVLFDLKFADPIAHRRWTGADNGPILRNLDVLVGMGIPFILRIPLVPGVTDGEENLRAIAEKVRGMPGLLRIELLAYNRVAGAKYAACGLEWNPGFEEARPVAVDPACLAGAGVEVCVP
jgi:pyruvate formate lyase activating enzyme